MKEGTAITRIAMVLITLGLAAYFGVYLWLSFTDPLVTTLAYSYTAVEGIEVSGFLVREETVLPARSGITNVLLGEGEKVGRGQTVAALYRDSRALDRQEQIRALELEIELQEYAMTQKDETSSAAELESSVISAVVALRADTALGDFARLEDQVLELKRAVLKRDYTYGSQADASRLSELNAQLHSLKSQSSRDVSYVTADRPGVFSAQVDGYESLLTPASAAALTPSALDELGRRAVSGNESALGKLITPSTWYFVAAVPEETARHLVPGRTVTVRFSGDFSQDVDMLIQSVSLPEAGRSAVLLSCDRFLSATTLLRQQTVEFVFREYQGLRVPKSAVQIITRETTDAETGQTVKSSETGVYAVVNGQAEFKAVEILSEGSEFYVVSPLGSERKMLRAGDEVIVRAKGLYDGKIVR